MRHIDEAETRSGHLPVSIRIEDRSMHIISVLNDWFARVAHVQKYISRCRTATLVMTPLSVYLVVFAEEAQLLENLTVRIAPPRRGWLIHKPSALLPRAAPKLQYLALRGMPVPWDSPLLSNISCLHIQDPWDDEVWFIYLWRLLDSNRGLRTLTISTNGRVSFRKKNHAFHPAPLVLDQLRCLHLVNIPPEFTLDLLPLISLPYCEDFRLVLPHLHRYQKPAPDTSDLLQTSLKYLPAHTLSTHESAISIEVDVKFLDMGFQAKLSVGDKPTRSCFVIKLWKADFQVTSRWVKDDLIPALRDPQVSLWISPEKMPSTQLPLSLFLSLSPRISRLGLNLVEHVREIIPLLSQTPWVLPGLQYLSFNAPCDIQALLIMVRNRYGLEENGALLLPLPFTELHIGPRGKQTEGIWEDTLAILKEILGSGLRVRPAGGCHLQADRNISPDLNLIEGSNVLDAY